MDNELTLPAKLYPFFSSFSHTVQVKKGDFLFREGSEARELYFIKNGKIQLSKLTPDGRELTFYISSKGELIGEMNLFCAASRHMLHAKALEDSQVISMDKDQLEQLLTKDQGLSIEYMKWMGERLQRTQTKFRDLVLNGKKGALYSTLIRMSNSFGIMREDGIELNLHLTNQELANFCGTSREVVNRMLSDLRKEGVISVDKGKITIHDLNYLKLEINCEDCPKELCKLD
ncbi:MAG TPA: Crp/Fnr family transcriptional regulator [Bacillus sp. (in: firmicutes)]|nr:Crp/Fnr family transcriptional regulator [Bacillus sp. (in: firmicutes)]